MLRSPLTRGFVLAFAAVAIATLGVGLALSTVPPADGSLFQGISIVGGSLLVAYVIEAVWLLPRLEAGSEGDEWLGFMVGVGLAGLVATAISLPLAQHRYFGHDNALDWLGLSWCAVSLLILGGTLVLQPLLAERRSRRPADPGPPAGGPGPGPSGGQ